MTHVGITFKYDTQKHTERESAKRLVFLFKAIAALYDRANSEDPKFNFKTYKDKFLGIAMPCLQTKFAAKCAPRPGDSMCEDAPEVTLSLGQIRGPSARHPLVGINVGMHEVDGKMYARHQFWLGPTAKGLCLLRIEDHVKLGRNITAATARKPPVQQPRDPLTMLAWVASRK